MEQSELRVMQIQDLEGWDMTLCGVLISEGVSVQASVELGTEDVSLLERCPHFRGCYVQASMELGPEDVSLFREVSSFS